MEGGCGGTAQQASEALYSCIVAVLSVAFLIRPFLVAMTLAIAANLLTSKALPARPPSPSSVWKARSLNYASPPECNHIMPYHDGPIRTYRHEC